MKKANLFLAALMALTMAGCREVPEDVKSRAEEQQGVTTSQTGSAASGDDTPAITSPNKIGNITFECEPDPIDTNEFYIFKSKKWIDCTNEDNYGILKEKMIKAAKDLIDLDVPADDIDIMVDTYTDEEEDQEGHTSDAEIYYTDDKGEAAVLYEASDTFLFWSLSGVKGDPFAYGERTVYKPDDYPDTVYDMNDGSKMTIKQAIEQADEKIKKIYDNNLLDENATLELHRIAVHETDNGNIIKLIYRKKILGLYMNYDGFLSMVHRENMRYSYCEISFYGDEQPYKIENKISDYINEKEKVDKIMSYEEAKNRVGTGLAANLTYTVKEAGLRYTCLFSQGDEYHTYRPMWCFVLHEPENIQTTQPDIYDPMNPYPRVTAFVDAINGDLYYCNPFSEMLSKNKMK